MAGLWVKTSTPTPTSTPPPTPKSGLTSGPILQVVDLLLLLSFFWRGTFARISLWLCFYSGDTLCPRCCVGVQKLALTCDSTQMGLLAASRIGRWLHARTAIMWTHTDKHRNGSHRSCDGKGQSCSCRHQQWRFWIFRFYRIQFPDLHQLINMN